MIACHCYEKAGGQIIGYELHIYNEYNDDDCHNIYQLNQKQLGQLE